VEFEHPIFLAGLLAAFIPLLVHLFDRRKARPLPFAAIEFVLRSRKRTASRLKLRRLILYALRTLLFVAIPLALAKPHRAVAGGTPAVPRGAAATAIVLDASLSMRANAGSVSRFQAAQQLSRDALSGLAPEEPVTVLVCKQPFSAPAAPSFDRAAARRLIDEAQATFAPADGSACLQAAASALAESPLEGKRIFFASDLTANSLRLDVPAPRLTGPRGELRPEVVLLDAAGGGPELPNAGITDLHIEPEPTLGARGYGFTFTVRNSSSRPLDDLAVQLKIAGKVVAKGALTVPARGTVQKTLSFRFSEGGVVRGEVELAHDALVEDDVRPFVLRVPREVRVLVVDGAPATPRFQDAAFFLEAALSAPGSPVHATTVDVDSFNAAPLAPGVDAVFLVDVPPLPPERVAELKALVEHGGGVLLAVGPNAIGPNGDADAFNAALGPLLPRPLRLLKTASERGTPGAEERAARFAAVLWSHPAFAVFGGDARDGLISARTYKYMLLEPGPVSFKTLASFDDGAPALVETDRGSGRILLDTSTLDRTWSDLAIRTAYLPLMQRLAAYLAGALDEHEVRSTRVGEPHPLDLKGWNGLSPAAILGPDGKPRALVAAQGELAPQVTGTDLPGLYTVVPPAAAATTLGGSLDFAVDPDPSESDLSRLDAQELVAHFGAGTRTVGGAPADPARSRAPAWTGLLVLAIAVFFFEGAVLAKP
jgi:hypothetical protein